MMRFDLPGGGLALFTTRADGNLSSTVGDGAVDGQLRRERLRERLGLRRLAIGRQVHGAIVAQGLEAGGALGGRVEADGYATAVEGLGLTVLVADCLPIVLACETGVATLHAGWRGMAAGILEEGVRTLRALSGAHVSRHGAHDAGEMLAIVGPGAGPCCYEVGAEVRAALGLDGASKSGGEERAGDARRKVDLKAVARQRLLAAGVGRVDDLEMCTICDRRFFSHRREGAHAGRQAAIAWLGAGATSVDDRDRARRVDDG